MLVIDTPIKNGNNKYNLSFKNKKIDYVTISDKAMSKIIEQLEQNKECIAIRISVHTKGCSGLSYQIDLVVKDDIEETDEMVNDNRANIFIDPKISLFIIGTLMDYQEERSEKTGAIISEGFVFVNPNEKGRCGCGESFFV